MKDSGIEWIGKIPADWETDRLQWHLEEIKEQNSPIQSERVLSLTVESGVIPYEDKGNQGNKSKENYEEYKLAYPETLVINSMNVIIGAVGISKYFGCVSPVYYVFRPTVGTDLRYIYYLFTNIGFQKELRKHAKGIMEIRLRISASETLKRVIPKPSYEEQCRIADFLDRRCAEIDTVIERTKDTISEYKKLKQSIITSAVTAGIRGHRPMKDSKIEWIDSIPAEWHECRIKNAIFPQEKDVFETDEIITCFRDGEVTLRKNRREDGFTVSFTENGYHGVDVGDLVIHGMDAFAGAIREDDFGYEVCKKIGAYYRKLERIEQRKKNPYDITSFVADIEAPRMSGLWYSKNEEIIKEQETAIGWLKLQREQVEKTKNRLHKPKGIVG